MFCFEFFFVEIKLNYENKIEIENKSKGTKRTSNNEASKVTCQVLCMYVMCMCMCECIHGQVKK